MRWCWDAARRRAALAAGLALLATLLLTGAARAVEGGSGTGGSGAAGSGEGLAGVAATARVGWGDDGLLRRAAWAPVEVRVAADRLVVGRIQVVADTPRGQVVLERPFEVSGGSEKLFRLVAPPAFGHRVTLVSGDVVLRVPVRWREPDGLVVGVAGPDVPAGPAPRVEALDVTGSWVAVDPAWLSTSARALSSLDTLVVDTATLAALDGVGRGAVATAVHDGLRLVVVPGDGSDPTVDALPVVPATFVGAGSGAALVPAETAFVTGPAASPSAASLPLGRGRVTLVTGDVGAAAAHVGLRADSPNRNAEGPVSRLVDQSRGAMEGATTSIPSAWWVAGFVGLFVVVAGPLNGLVLTWRGRRDLAWVTVPVITLVFVVGAFGTSRQFGDRAGVSGRLAWWQAGQGQELVVAAARTPGGGPVELRLPGGGWDVVGNSDGAAAVVRQDGGDVVATSVVDSFQRATVLGFRALDEGPPLDVEATLRGDVLVVEITNLAGRDLTDVRLHAATLERDLDDLAAGATTTVEVDTRGRLPERDPWAAFEVPRDVRGTPRQPDALRSLFAWAAFAGQPGSVWVSAAAGDPDDDGHARALGRVTTSLGDVVAVAATPTWEGDVVSPFAVGRDLLTPGFGEVWQQTPLMLEGETTAVLRYALPAGATDVAELVTSLDRGLFEGGAVRGAVEQVCREVEERDADGNLVAVHEECGAVAVEPPADMPRDCPPDAISCQQVGQEWVVCFEGGDCAAQQPAPLPGALGGRDGRLQLEIWDTRAATWVDLDLGLDATEDDGRFVDDHGEVLLRARGQFFPLDISARGIGARLAGGTA